MALRHQLMVLRRQVRGRVQLTDDDRLFLIQLYRWFPLILKAITIIRPQTLVRWHRAGFRWYWHWKSRLRVSVLSFHGQFSVDFTTNITESDFRYTQELLHVLTAVNCDIGAGYKGSLIGA